MVKPQLSILPLENWIDGFERPLVVSGPCSAETEEQLIGTARQVAAISKCRIFRAGIWKPRTRPCNFEGVGEDGLRWMQRVKEETGLLTTVEVANPKHIELALRYGIDVLWVGARTVVNPFSVQEISDALRGVDIPVMVKNPLHPDINLWLGAIERLNASGVRRMIGIHRGFHHTGPSPYRNDPMWEIPIELKRLCPDLPLICDPSHISGNRALIAGICQKAIDLAMDGLMVETHIDPASALTDTEQQITPAALDALLNKLIIRTVTGSKEFQDMLEELRAGIDMLDGELIGILTRRMEIVRQIGRYKKDNDITIFQLRRWSSMINDRLEQGVLHGLDRDFLLRLLQLVHKESIQEQIRILNNNSNSEENDG